MIQGKIGLEFPSVLLELLLLPGYGLCQGLGCLQLKDGSKLFPRASLSNSATYSEILPKKYVIFPSFYTQPFPSPLSFPLYFYGLNFLLWLSAFLPLIQGGQSRSCSP